MGVVRGGYICSMVRPIIMVIRASMEVSLVFTVATNWPLRRTVTRSARAMISSKRWVI